VVVDAAGSVGESLIESLLGLPWHDQYEIHRLLGLSLGFENDEQDTRDKRQRELAGRAEALEAMRVAAEHLSLPDGERLAARDYDQARRELGLSVSSAAIIRRWGAWREAVSVMGGAPARTTQRQHVRWLAINNSVRARAQHLEGIRAWLESEPATITKAAYDDYALSPDRQNTGKQDTSTIPLVTADAVTDALALPWGTTLAVARGKQTLGTAQRERLKKMRREGGSLGLVSIAYVALLNGGSEKAAYKLVRGESFPVPVAYTTMSKRRAWYRRDVEAHHAGRRVPKRELFEAQERIILSEEVRALLGQSARDFRQTVERSQRANQEEMLDRDLLPRPDGRANHALYWLRADVEAWDERQRKK
jgi:predicted DNA-binding transcriptional regulator AlpA